MGKRVWLVRAGKDGQDEEAALESDLAIIGFDDVPDLSHFKDRDALEKALVAADPQKNAARAGNRARQLWAFRESLSAGDIVVLPRKGSGQVALGEVKGPYRFARVGDEERHTRGVHWARPDVARSVFKQDLLYSFGAFLTVCEITRNDAARRVRAVFAGDPDPGFETAESGDVPVERADVDGGRPDLVQVARDEITAYVRANFPGHEFARLIDAILQAEGYDCHRSTPGPDGGADILAAKGPLGLDGPTLCVQVKATEAVADVNVFRSLQGSMASFGADQGLLVCWGGFTQAAIKEARQHVFRIRLWDQTQVIEALMRNYEKIPAEIQAELPLKRIWVLLPKEDEV